MMTSCCAILALVFLVITNLCIIISFATPYWLEVKDSKFSLVFNRYNRGLWAYCDDSGCTWVFQEGFGHYANKIWWIATQSLMTFGLVLGLLSLLLATMALCCECRGCNASHAIAGLLTLGFVTMGVAVVIFGVSAHNDVEFEAELGWTYNAKAKFSWSFWLGIASSGWSLFTAIIYCCEGRQRR